MKINKLALAVVAGTLMTAAFATPSSAQAASRDGVCDAGEFCYYYNSNHAGIGLRLHRLDRGLRHLGSRRATSSRDPAPVRASA